MNDKQIVEYCRNLVIANLRQYSTQGYHIVNEIYELTNKNNKELLKNHCDGIIALLEKCIEILEEEI